MDDIIKDPDVNKIHNNDFERMVVQKIQEHEKILRQKDDDILHLKQTIATLSGKVEETLRRKLKAVDALSQSLSNTQQQLHQQVKLLQELKLHDPLNITNSEASPTTSRINTPSNCSCSVDQIISIQRELSFNSCALQELQSSMRTLDTTVRNMEPTLLQHSTQLQSVSHRNEQLSAVLRVLQKRIPPNNRHAVDIKVDSPNKTPSTPKPSTTSVEASPTCTLSPLSCSSSSSGTLTPPRTQSSHYPIERQLIQNNSTQHHFTNPSINSKLKSTRSPSPSMGSHNANVQNPLARRPFTLSRTSKDESPSSVPQKDEQETTNPSFGGVDTELLSALHGSQWPSTQNWRMVSPRSSSPCPQRAQHFDNGLFETKPNSGVSYASTMPTIRTFTPTHNYSMPRRASLTSMNNTILDSFPNTSSILNGTYDIDPIQQSLTDTQKSSTLSVANFFALHRPQAENLPLNPPQLSGGYWTNDLRWHHHLPNGDATF